MELQDTRFVRFVRDFWIRYQKFRGAAKICAVFLNFFILIFKLVFCGLALLILAPHLAASALRNKHRMTGVEWVLYAILVVLCLALDVPVLLVGGVGAVLCGGLLVDRQFVTALVCAVISGVILLGEKALLKSLFRRDKEHSEEEKEEEEEEQEQEEEEEDIEELPFCQLFTVGTEMCLLIDHIEMCPDETAFIRVADDEGYTPIYKRKVRRDKQGARYIVFNGKNHYLDDKRTQPVITKK